MQRSDLYDVWTSILAHARKQNKRDLAAVARTVLDELDQMWRSGAWSDDANLAYWNKTQLRCDKAEMRKPRRADKPTATRRSRADYAADET